MDNQTFLQSSSTKTSSSPLALMATPPINLWEVLSESKRIINAHSRHFLALSVLFLLPNSFFITVYPSVFGLVFDPVALYNTASLLRGFLSGDDQPPPLRADPDIKTALLRLFAYVIVVTVFNLLAIGSIAYSVVQGFYGRPLKFISAVKSSFASFLPLLSTLITTNSIFFGIFLIIGFVAFSLTKLIEITISSLEIGLVPPFVIGMIISCVIVLRFQIIWISSWINVVVESVWGFTPFQRSKSFTKGMKRELLSIIFFFGVPQLALVWVSYLLASALFNENDENGETWTKAWTNEFFVLQIAFTFGICVTLLRRICIVTLLLW